MLFGQVLTLILLLVVVIIHTPCGVVFGKRRLNR
ncbi:MAG: IlvGEDA operon leader peptide [Plesiomonas sp.]